MHGEDVILQVFYESMRVWRVLWRLCAAALRAVHSEDVVLQVLYESMRVWRVLWRLCAAALSEDVMNISSVAFAMQCFNLCRIALEIRFDI